MGWKCYSKRFEVKLLQWLLNLRTQLLNADFILFIHVHIIALVVALNFHDEVFVRNKIPLVFAFKYDCIDRKAECSFKNKKLRFKWTFFTINIFISKHKNCSIQQWKIFSNFVKICEDV